MKPIGILGGTFDPIHYGHLRTALELFECLRLEEVRFVPCRIPPHDKSPVASAKLRLEMVRTAVDDQPGFIVDERELHRDGPSFSVDTLASMREEFPKHPLCLIIGMDAFNSLTTWHRWEELLSLAHLVVAHRPGAKPPVGGELGRLLDRCRSRDPADLHAATAGRVLLHAVTQLDISSSAIRLGVFRGESPVYLMPDAVAALIETHACYAGGVKSGGE